MQVFCIKPCDIRLILLWDAPVMSQRTESHPVAVDKNTYGINCLLLLLLFLFECLKKSHITCVLFENFPLQPLDIANYAI